MVRPYLAGIVQAKRPSASVVSGARATVHGAPGTFMRWSTVTLAPAIGRPSSSRRTATWRNRLPKPSARRVVPESMIRARLDALSPLFGRPVSVVVPAVDEWLLLLVVDVVVVDTDEVVVVEPPIEALNGAGSLTSGVPSLSSSLSSLLRMPSWS